MQRSVTASLCMLIHAGVRISTGNKLTQVVIKASPVSGSENDS